VYGDGGDSVVDEMYRNAKVIDRLVGCWLVGWLIHCMTIVAGWDDAMVVVDAFKLYVEVVKRCRPPLPPNTRTHTQILDLWDQDLDGFLEKLARLPLLTQPVRALSCYVFPLLLLHTQPESLDP
jgi:hypothetical protein